MKIAIIERIENYDEEKPFNNMEKSLLIIKNINLMNIT